MKRENRTGRCVICGESDVLLTNDHLPPRSFFSEPIPNQSNLITIKSCPKCNGGSSVDDELFKVISELAQKKCLDMGVLRETIKKTFKRRPHIPWKILNSMHRVYLPGDLGCYEEKFFLDLDFNPFLKTSEKILKGLFHKHSGDYYSDGFDLKMSVRNEIVEDDLFQKAIYEKISDFKKVTKVVGEFSYAYLKFENESIKGMVIVLNFLGGLEVYGVIAKGVQKEDSGNFYLCKLLQKLKGFFLSFFRKLHFCN